MTVWPARAAAAIVFGLVLSPIVASAPSVSAAGQPAPVSVTMIAALTVPQYTTAFIPSDQLERYTSEFGLLTRELDQVIDRPIALGIDPSIIASIRVLGTNAPDSAVAWLDRLAGATNETFPLTWADSDITLGLQAGSGEVLAPESFAFAIDPALFSAASAQTTPTPDPTETPAENTVPPLPTDESLVAWDYTVSSIAWPAMNSVTASDLAVIGSSYDTTILSSDNIGATGASTALTTIGDATALVADSALSAQFGSTVSAGSGPEWEAAIAGLVASVAAVPSTDDNPASVLLALGREVPIGDLDMGSTVDSIAQAPGVQVVGIDNLLATAAPASAALVDLPQNAEAVASVATMLAEETKLHSYLVIAEDPSLITSEQRLELLASISNSWDTSQPRWQLAVSDYIYSSVALRDSVKIAKSSTINLWADRASLPVTVSNELSQPITVYVTVRPMSPLLKIEDAFVAVTVEPNSQGKASIPVQSLSNGNVELEISLHSSTGQAIGETTYVRTTVQAGWETPVTIGFGIAVVLIFAAGIIRTIVRRRRARASEE